MFIGISEGATTPWESPPEEFDPTAIFGGGGGNEEFDPYALFADGGNSGNSEEGIFSVS